MRSMFAGARSFTAKITCHPFTTFRWVLLMRLKAVGLIGERCWFRRLSQDIRPLKVTNNGMVAYRA